MQLTSFSSWNTRLRQERVLRNWRQQDLADHLGTTVATIKRWERGSQQPSAYFRVKLCALFGMSAEEFGWVEQTQPPLSVSAAAKEETSMLWIVPYTRNPFFTGRDSLLELLHQQLGQEHRVALSQSTVLSGLGGIGKTATAIEYVYRHVHDYTAVFWMGAETAERLVSSFVALAETLQLPERREAEKAQVVSAVLRWLTTHQGWLLVFDNVEDLEVVRPFVPTVVRGSVLFTTRLQAVGTLAQQVMVETMGLAEGTLLLLRRAKLLSAEAFLDQVSPELLAEAESLVIELDFFPLALDQAGAYIEEVGCTPAAYLELYHFRRKDLLHRRGHTPSDHPDSVATTWSLSFHRIKQRNPVAADLLQMCAFLEPDAIPEELLQEGCLTVCSSLMRAVATDVLAFHEACEELLRFSLVQRDAQARLLRIHRLVQTVLMDMMTQAEREYWSQRVIEALEAVFPEITVRTEHGLRKQAARLLPHALLCLHRGERTEKSLVLASLAYKTALALQAQGRYAEAEPVFLHALCIQEKTLGPEHPTRAITLNSLALLYWLQGKYEQAERFFQHALHIRENTLGASHAETAATLNDLANLLRDQGNYAQAEPLYQRALTIREQILGPDDPRTANSLNNLALLYKSQGRYAEAEPLLQRVLAVQEQVLAPDDLTYALNNLATLYWELDKHREAEPLLRRALAIRELVLGPDHPETAVPLNNLAAICQGLGKDAEAETLASRTLLAQLGEEQGIRKPVASYLHCAEEHPDCVNTEPLGEAVLTSQKASDDARSEDDPLQEFLTGCCELHPRAMCSSRDLWQAYTRWANDHQECYPLSRGAFTAQLKRHGCQADRTPTARIWRGIALVKPKV